MDTWQQIKSLRDHNYQKLFIEGDSKPIIDHIKGEVDFL